MEEETARIRDNRGGQWFYVHNAVYDMGLSCEALAMYSAIARFANNQTGTAYFSGKKFMAQHKIGTGKLRDAKRELIAAGLIAETGHKTVEGAIYYELCPVLPQPRGSATVAEGVGQGSRGGSATVADNQDLETRLINKTKQTHTEREPEPPDLRKLDEPLRLYAEHCFQFDRIGNDPALIAACYRIGVDAVGDALRQCAQEAQKPGHLKRHTPTISKLLHDTDNMLKRAAMYQPDKPTRQLEPVLSQDQQTVEWLEDMTDEQREHEFSEAERLGQTWPEEVLTRWKQSQRQTSQKQLVA